MTKKEFRKTRKMQDDFGCILGILLNYWSGVGNDGVSKRNSPSPLPLVVSYMPLHELCGSEGENIGEAAPFLG